jgi:hypothetical protein
MAALANVRSSEQKKKKKKKKNPFPPHTKSQSNIKIGFGFSFTLPSFNFPPITLFPPPVPCGFDVSCPRSCATFKAEAILPWACLSGEALCNTKPVAPCNNVGCCAPGLGDCDQTANVCRCRDKNIIGPRCEADCSWCKFGACVPAGYNGTDPNSIPEAARVSAILSRTAKCLCQPGWYGNDCSIPDCAAEQNCNGHGTCVRPHVCECQSQWIKNCSAFGVPSCPTGTDGAVCFGHGKCVDTNKCVCADGWTTSDCSAPFCGIKGCGAGRCVKPKQCECPLPIGSGPAEWCGSLCDVKCVDVPTEPPVPTTAPPTPVPTQAIPKGALVFSLGGRRLFTVTTTTTTTTTTMPPTTTIDVNATTTVANSTAATTTIVNSTTAATTIANSTTTTLADTTTTTEETTTATTATTMAPTAPPSTTVDMLPLLSGTGEKSAVLRTSDPFATMAMRMLISGSDRLYYEGNTPFPVGLGVGFDGYVNGSDQLVVLFERPAFLVSFQISGNGVGWSHLVLLLPPKKSRQNTEPAYQLETRELTGASSYWAARGKQVPLGFVLRMTTPIGNVRLDSFSVQEQPDPEPTTAEPSTVANTTTTAATTEAIGAPPESALPPWIWYAVGGGGGCLLLTLIIVVVVVVVRKRRASPSTSAGGTEMSSARDVDDESKYRSAVQDPRGIYVSSGTSSAQFRAGYGDASTSASDKFRAGYATTPGAASVSSSAESVQFRQSYGAPPDTSGQFRAGYGGASETPYYSTSGGTDNELFRSASNPLQSSSRGSLQESGGDYHAPPSQSVSFQPQDRHDMYTAPPAGYQ